MFGDPGVGKYPVVRLRIQAEVDRVRGIEVVTGTEIVPDVVKETMMGDFVSVGLRVPAGEQDVVVTGAEADPKAGSKHPVVGMIRPMTILAGQLRPIALQILQLDYFKSSKTSVPIDFHISAGGKKSSIRWHMPLRHSPSVYHGSFKITTSFIDELPPPAYPAQVSYAMIVPPSQPDLEISAPPPVILATHGAGVDAESSFWTSSMPSRAGGWAVLPTGKTEWGEDWHGGSVDDAWAARYALNHILGKLGIEISNETLLIGHSNGGQGAWHLAARNPDNVVGGRWYMSCQAYSAVIAASGWLTIQDYVPYQKL